MEIITKNTTIADFIENYLIASISDQVFYDITAMSLSGLEQVSVFADLTFQRKYGAWSTQKKSKYIESIFNNRVYTQIVLAKCTDSYRLKNSLSKSINWSILDGMHRSNVIKEFINDEFGFTGYLSNGKKQVYCENRKFSSLSPREKKVFLRKTIEVKTIQGVPESTFSEIFINVNDGEPLNMLEKLNAIDCEMSVWCRKMEKEFVDFLKSVNKIRSQLHRMSGMGLIVKMYLNSQGLSNSKLVTLDNKNIRSRFVDKDDQPVSLNSLVVDYLESNLLVSLTNICRSRKGTIQMRNIWTFSIIHHYFFVKNSLNYSDISETFTDETLWNFSEEIYNILSRRSKIQEAADESENNPHKNAPYFHMSIGRYHLEGDAKYISSSVTEELGNSLQMINRMMEFENRTQVAQAA